MQHIDIINKFGGVTEMSRALGHPNRTTVKHWEHTKQIPRWRWHEVLAAARSKRMGLTEADFQAPSK